MMELRYESRTVQIKLDYWTLGNITAWFSGSRNYDDCRLRICLTKLIKTIESVGFGEIKKIYQKNGNICCMTTDEKELLIEFKAKRYSYFGDPGIEVQCGNVVTVYSIEDERIFSHYIKSSELPRNRIWYYYKNSKNFHCTVNFNDGTVLMMRMVINKNINIKPDFITRLDNYLLSLITPIDTQTIYAKIIDLFCLKQSHFESICMDWFKIVGEDDDFSFITNKEYAKSSLHVRKGGIECIGITEDDESFQVFNDGHWIYQTDNVKIAYTRLQREKNHNLVFDFKSELSTIDIAKVHQGIDMNRICQKISELQNRLNTNV